MKLKENCVSIISIVIAFLSLFIAINSLCITKRLYTLTSKDYIPLITFDITDNILTITNANNDLYKIDGINVIGVEAVGFDDYSLTNTFVQIPLVFVSASESFWYEKKSEKTFVLNFEDSHALWEVEPVEKTIYEKIVNKIEKDYGTNAGNNFGRDNTKGYATPCLQTKYYYIDIEYEDKFENVKHVYYKYFHIHGMGYRKKRISADEIEKFLSKYKKIPWQEKNFEKLWEYLIKEYRYSWIEQ